jgi:H+/gluconate symporter-like permease
VLEFVGLLIRLGCIAGVLWILTVTGIGDLIADALQWFFGNSSGGGVPSEVDTCVVSGHC